jgi:hypothetical protein
MTGIGRWFRALFEPKARGIPHTTLNIPVPEGAKRPIVRMSQSALAQISTPRPKPTVNPFELPTYAPGVLPTGKTKLAMDGVFSRPPARQLRLEPGQAAAHRPLVSVLAMLVSRRVVRGLRDFFRRRLSCAASWSATARTG